jgi:hypothetical protein
MTSQIVFDTIDEAYPVAGQDNNSQGFRDNFSIIKNGLNTANSEITDLQNTTAKTDTDNDFNGVEISNAVFVNNTISVQNLSSQSNDFTIQVNEADMYYGTATNTNLMIITFDNWPDAPKYRTIKLILNSSGVQKNVRFAGGAMRYSSNVPLVSGSRTVTITSDPNSSYHFEVSSYDAGSTIYVHYLGVFAQ